MPTKNKGRLTYILDTNVLIQSPTALFAFDEHEVVLTDITIEELDGLKSSPGDVGAAARETNRILDGLRSKGNVIKGVGLPTGGSIRVETNHVAEDLPEGWDKGKPDNRILRVCKAIAGERKEKAILVTNDISMRLKADIIGIRAEEYRTEKAPAPDEQYKGRRDITVPEKILELLRREKAVAAEDAGAEDAAPNEFFSLTGENGGGHASAVCDDGLLLLIEPMAKGPCGIKLRNEGQRFAACALMSPSPKMPLVILKGGAGTAKTFLSLACGVYGVMTGEYKRMLITRPNVKFDDDIGFLKGDEFEKISPLLRPVFDNLETIATNLLSDPMIRRKFPQVFEFPEFDRTNALVRRLFERELITGQALAYIRGRSITDTFILIDEAQNMTPSQATGVVTRAGNGSKVVLAGDTGQIDNIRLDSRTNGLSYASEKMKGSGLCAQVLFGEHECTRSPLATEAVARMAPKGAVGPLV
jgi:PhoH-like ATPase